MILDPNENTERITDLPVFFIIGSPRSGTTLLRTIFDAHSKVNIPFEFPFILFFYDKYGTIKNWTEENILSFYYDLTKNIKFEFWSFDGWRIDPELLRLNMLKYTGNHTYSEICKSIYYQFNSYFEKSEILLLGDKNPTYSTRIETLKNIFPDSKFIHITRDFRDHILSMQTVDFGGKLTPMVAYRWRKFQKEIYLANQKNPDLIFHIKYEELVSETEKVISDLCSFLSIPYEPSSIEFYKQNVGLIKIYGAEKINKYHKSLLQPITADKINRWKNNMHENEIKIADMVVGKWAERFGYERKYKNINLLLYFYVLPIYFHFAFQWVLGLFVKMLPHKTKNKIIYRNSIFENLYERIYIRLRGLNDQKSNRKL